MPIEVNKPGVAKAETLISNGDVDMTTAWDFSAEDGNAILGDPPDWAAYAEWFLAVDTSANEETKDRYAFPFGKGGKVYRSGVIAAKQRAAQVGYDNIMAAADALLTMIDEQEQNSNGKASREKSNQKGAEKEAREKGRQVEYRAAELRATDGGEGTFDGYAITWNTVDSYNSMFRRGCAKKTLQERRGKIKVMWNHEELVGRVVDAVEDDHGLLVRCKLTMELQRAKEVRALMLDGVVNTMSFGFDSVKEHIENGVRVIDEIRLWEVSPVVFAANERTSIGAVRSLDFTETFTEDMTEITGDILRYSLWDTLLEIQWMNPDVALIDAAITDFHARYVRWFSQWMMSEDAQDMSGPNELSSAAAAAFKTRSPEKIAAEWPITLDEAKRLLMGKTLGLEPRSRLSLISPELAAAHAKQRAAEVDKLFHELRAGGFTTAERTRMSALLGTEKPQAASKLVEAVEQYVNQLTGAK